MEIKNGILVEGIMDPVSTDPEQLQKEMNLLIEMTSDLASALGPDEFIRQCGETPEERIASIRERYSRRISDLNIR